MRDRFGTSFLAKNFAWTILFGFLFLSGCDTRPSRESLTPNEDAGNRLKIVATVGMVADIVREVGGERVHVIQLIGSSIDPHLYRATRDDVQEIMRADIVFYSGLRLEGRMGDTLAKLMDRKKIVGVTEALDHSLLLTVDESRKQFDPHVWMNVSLWSKCVDVIVKTLSEVDATGAESFAQNGKRYQEQLTQLHEYGLRCLQSIPVKQRLLITSHDAFGYMQQAYGLEVQGIQGISTESEASLKRVNQLVDLLLKRQIPAVFVETSVSHKGVDALVEGVRAKGGLIEVYGKLFSDAMGPKGTYEGTYIGMLDHNFTNITRALGGDAPATGFQGKLTTAAEKNGASTRNTTSPAAQSSTAH
ncbi:MAG TPA: zinc ABC transporter substrate-binding protein [Pirellulaceae bacterium]|nr:zinc ABC transporter substrate-binding protein [Pirellulaceae bacterium]HMO91225.1 zinc ABC transporter substrate-binding protein [Pirellulaceae bacterium]HMP68591.1 zinc ABC transporter substrate-binding protein [Pirellulaceae bacterium]